MESGSNKYKANKKACSTSFHFTWRDHVHTASPVINYNHPLKWDIEQLSKRTFCWFQCICCEFAPEMGICSGRGWFLLRSWRSPHIWCGSARSSLSGTSSVDGNSNTSTIFLVSSLRHFILLCRWRSEVVICLFHARSHFLLWYNLWVYHRWKTNSHLCAIVKYEATKPCVLWDL